MPAPPRLICFFVLHESPHSTACPFFSTPFKAGARYGTPAAPSFSSSPLPLLASSTCDRRPLPFSVWHSSTAFPCVFGYQLPSAFPRQPSVHTPPAPVFHWYTYLVIVTHTLSRGAAPGRRAPGAHAPPGAARGGGVQRVCWPSPWSEESMAPWGQQDLCARSEHTAVSTLWWTFTWRLSCCVCCRHLIPP